MDQRRCLIERRPESEGDSVFFFCQNGEVTFEAIEVRPLLWRRVDTLGQEILPGEWQALKDKSMSSKACPDFYRSSGLLSQGAAGNWPRLCP